VKLPTRWSYSSLGTYESCPAKYKFSYIDGIEWPSSPAMARGTRMHLMAEEFVNGTVDRVHPEIQRIGPQLLTLKSSGAKTEAVWLLNKDWQPVQDQSQAWVKAIIDVHFVDQDVLHLKDYKSGRMYDDHRSQLELYGLMGLCTYPDIKRAETAALYMDTGHEGMQSSIIRAMLPKMVQGWQDRAIIMMEDREWVPKPGPACKWCSFSKDKDGPCTA
jgi:hypothetical protein